MSAATLPSAQRYLKWIAVFNPDQLMDLLADSPSRESYWNNLNDYFPAITSQGSSNGSEVAQAMYFDGIHYLPGDLNTKIDRTSMAHSLELRSPFQDHKVVEFAYSLPTAWRHNGHIGKMILRRGCAAS